MSAAFSAVLFPAIMALFLSNRLTPKPKFAQGLIHQVFAKLRSLVEVLVVGNKRVNARFDYFSSHDNTELMLNNAQIIRRPKPRTMPQ